jgi:hypothetical protein
MRLVLFDWAVGGHHPIYIRRFAEAVSKPFLGEAGAAVEQRPPATIRLPTRRE